MRVWGRYRDYRACVSILCFMNVATLLFSSSDAALPSLRSSVMNMDLRSLGGGAVFLGDHLANVVCWHEGLEKDEFIEVCERHFGIATHGERGGGRYPAHLDQLGVVTLGVASSAVLGVEQVPTLAAILHRVLVVKVELITTELQQQVDMLGGHLRYGRDAADCKCAVECDGAFQALPHGAPKSRGFFLRPRRFCPHSGVGTFEKGRFRDARHEVPG